MLIAVRFHDHSNKLDVRNTHLDAHIRWLREHASVILVGGSLRDAPEEPAIGGLWIVQAPSKEAVTELIRSDPFWIYGLRSGVEILYWQKAFPEVLTPV